MTETEFYLVLDQKQTSSDYHWLNEKFMLPSSIRKSIASS